jgi:hypothetical protein
MSKLVPETRRARRVEGALGTQVAVLHESAQGGMRKLRCPATHQLAVPTSNPDGSTVLKTPNGTTYVTKRMR